jgi:hypothetical protein
MNNNLVEIEPEVGYIEGPVQAREYNVWNAMPKQSLRRSTARKNLFAASPKAPKRNGASRNLIYNTLGVRSPRPMHAYKSQPQATFGEISNAPNVSSYAKRATRSISPQAKQLGAKRRRKATRRRKIRR